MAVLLYAAPGFDAAALTGALADLGVPARARILAPSALGAPVHEDASIAVVILPSAGVTSIGEHVAHLRAGLGAGARLVVCAPRLTARDRDDLVECGASEIVVPRTWSPADVADRVLGALIAAGDVDASGFGALRGATSPMRRLYENIAVVAGLADPVVVLGETGTGKELVAAEIHRRSGRPDPWFPINCAALTPELLESELFGHERGAFSGAAQSRRGLLAEAGESTVFLDEIGELAPTAQAKLLRVLEERTARAVGSNKWHPVSARVVLATNVDLERACVEGAFRRDLYERIAGFSLVLCPLRERLADIPLLVGHFLDDFNREHGSCRRVPRGALDRLFEHDWPGNVRELRQAVRRAAAYAESADGDIDVTRLHDAARRRPERGPRHAIAFDPGVDSWRDVHDRARKRYFRAALAATGGSKKAAAKRAGMSVSQFYDILKQIADDGAHDSEE